MSLVEVELLDAGNRINLGETLIAGRRRHHGARIVTRHEHVSHVNGLDVLGY